ncbi:carboxymuconolactone decarboxylase family protein [Actomonas aquatica]|uniref:Carboxymuconolactone decarboxylase family protein n=1 Tax=Actomonas aquatica TaxID=2866162 RepID=A0ABZ1C5J2_9BACT|nr:carboxymuconolactone decarboxylase family protein [Opitutus sp. WL0086]WRQ86617.1 carboxymuconolactone decarboxylase family protein [Opitutus sp. WL0086]
MSSTQAQPASTPVESGLERVSPALAAYSQRTSLAELWQRPELSPRDRSIVTVSILVARGQTSALKTYVNLALDNGVKPGEISELITHLAFYSGWANATGAIEVVADIFAERGIGEDQLPAVAPELLPLDKEAEAKRASTVDAMVGPTSPGLVMFTADPLFLDLWLRPGLAPRDRSLVTVSSLIANGQAGQITFHLNKAMDNGLTQTEAGEVIAQAAFYAGWPNAFSAVSVFKRVFETRAE